MAWFPKHFLGKGACVCEGHFYQQNSAVPSALSWGTGSAPTEAEECSIVNL